MRQKIKEFMDGSFLEYDKGNFDDWCVYLNRPDGTRIAPRDIDYFQQLKNLADKYGRESVYADYVKIYDFTTNKLTKASLDIISEISLHYGDDALIVDIIFSILYMAMIAEENKAYTRLGKRIKRLGIYKLLLEGCSAQHSANFMRGMGWREIAKMCEECGF